MRKNLSLFGFLAFAVLSISACTAPAEEIDMEAVTAEIQALEDGYAAAEKAKDADGVAAYYSEDAVSYSRNSGPRVGRAAIRESIAKDMAEDTLGGYSVFKVVDLFVEGNKAVEIGSWTQFDASGAETENGNYMSYFEKSDGKYECVRDMTTTASPVKSDM